MTGKTVEEAIEAALDQLGVAETDAEIVIVEEPKSGCSASDELVRGSEREFARFNPGRRDRHAGRGPHRMEASVGTADKPLIPRTRHASRPKRPRARRAAAELPQSPRREQLVGSPAKTKDQVRTVRERHRPRLCTKPPKRPMRVLTAAALQVPAAGNVHAREGVEAVGEWRTVRMESPTNLRVEPVVALDRLRRRR